ncbi:ATP-binding protein [Oculatella sp. LEGE 06141]|uniref:P-loop NTPase fold protein n=1 Tax=Oculatella sp. LEGE 06141 TaxID=1828648 RepID=UPI00188277C7|nr:P-loop NTPase fold protein [Oculatella sp. LEGE 06141]MBE9177429.1 ATP-binding protein [Oculatella sp. LEGE 06141]
MSLLEPFREAYRNLDLLPLLDPQELGKFRVEYGADVLAELEQLVEDDDSRDGKIIFAGHRGCGKSTLLAEFGRQCDERGYFVVFFSIADTIEMSDVNHINILFAIALNMMVEAEKRQVNISTSVKESLYKWFATRTRIETEATSAEAGAGFDLFKFISGKLKTEATIRNEIKHEFERNISDLVGRLNEIAALVEAATQKQVLVIIDDLDKLDLGLVRQIYQDHIKALFQPGFRVVFTIPVSSLREGSLRAIIVSAADDQIVEMPVAKLFDKGERRKPHPVSRPEMRETLCHILHKRIPNGVIEPDIAEQIVFYSGGVLRELIRIANICCRICLRSIRRHPDRTDIIINQAVLIEAIKDIRLDFETPLGKADYQILQATYDTFKPDDPKDQTFLDLLHGLHILEYRNDEVWYDTHPIVTDLLKRKGLVNDT